MTDKPPGESRYMTVREYWQWTLIVISGLLATQVWMHSNLNAQLGEIRGVLLAHRAHVAVIDDHGTLAAVVSAADIEQIRQDTEWIRANLIPMVEQRVNVTQEIEQVDWIGQQIRDEFQRRQYARLLSGTAGAVSSAD